MSHILPVSPQVLTEPYTQATQAIPVYVNVEEKHIKDVPHSQAQPSFQSAMCDPQGPYILSPRTRWPGVPAHNIGTVSTYKDPWAELESHMPSDFSPYWQF